MCRSLGRGHQALSCFLISFSASPHTQLMQTVKKQRCEPTQHTELEMTRSRRTHLQSLSQPGVASTPSGRRFVVLDMENIFTSMRHSQVIYEQVDGATSGNELRMDVDGLTQRARGDGSPEACDSRDGTPDVELMAIPGTTVASIRELYAKRGWKMESVHTDGLLGERVKRVVASFLHKAERQDWRAPSPTIVLFTGDGEVLRGGFLRDAVRRGVVHVEVHSWLHAMCNGYFDLQESYPHRVRICALDDDVNNLLITVASLQRKPKYSPLFYLVLTVVCLLLSLMVALELKSMESW